LLEALDNAPGKDSKYTVHKARFGTGHLQILLSLYMKKGNERFWYSPGTDESNIQMISSILSVPNTIRCVGKPPTELFESIYMATLH
jgi:hypothetical protein